MTDAAVQADVLETEELKTPVVEEKETPELPEGDKPQDDAEKVKQDKPEPTEAEKIKYAMQKRIDKQTAVLAERERQLQEAQDQLLKYTKSQETDQAPQEDDYETTEDYLKALGRWEAEQESKAKDKDRLQKERDAQYQKMVQERQQLAAEQEIEFKKVTPDYDEKVSEVETTIRLLTDAQKSSTEFQVFRDMLFSSDNMPALTYELGKNPDLLEEMMTMNPLQIARKIARLEIAIENAPKKELKPTPAPPSPISGKGTPSEDPDKMSTDEWMKWRQKQLNKRK